MERRINNKINTFQKKWNVAGVEVDNKFFGFHSKKRTSKEILDLYLKYIQVNKDKSVIKRALKHIYGLNKGKSGAKEYRQTINDLMMLGDLKEASHKLSKFLYYSCIYTAFI